MTQKKGYKFPANKRTNWRLNLQDKASLKQPVYHKGVEGLVPTYHTYYFSIGGVIRFQNNMHHAAKLGKAERILLDYLTTVMDPVTNVIPWEDGDKQDCIKFLRNQCGKSYKVATMMKAMTRLRKTPYIIHRKSLWRYVVNPLYFTRGTLLEHRALIASLLSEGTNWKKQSREIMQKMKFDAIKGQTV